MTPSETTADLDVLFQPYQLRELTLRNRIVVSPMATYSAEDGFVTDWHVQHVGKLAAGGAGLVFVEQSSVNTQGRITHGCLGIWKDEHVAGLKRLTALIASLGAASAIQIAHSGRKGASQRPVGDLRAEFDPVRHRLPVPHRNEPCGYRPGGGGLSRRIHPRARCGV
jgi:2,4-dienoyl-CoA reductase-like NADH-dependent reductase (Old Yellow Enzyme family)